MPSLWDIASHRGAGFTSTFFGPTSSVNLAELATGSTLGGKLEQLRDRCVLLATRAQLPTALALVELDAVAGRVVLCTPDIGGELLSQVAKIAGADAILWDIEPAERLPVMSCPLTANPLPMSLERRAGRSTEWVLLTSGTTGIPKLVVHSLESLAGALPQRTTAAGTHVWSTFYDIRRYGGLQIYLRAVLSGTPMVLSSAAESTRDFFRRGARRGVSHISGTPSHWRRALMSGDATLLAPKYVRLSGEIADQAVLDGLRRAYPDAQIAHAFASTEGGVAFDVNDGFAGFPAAMLGKHGAMELEVRGGTLHVRSGRIASRYLGEASSNMAGADGYVDTGDLVELRVDRYHFLGRKGGIINVGGLKVYPEEVEAVLNADPRVRMSLVRPRRNPITGAVVVAEVVMADAAATGTDASERLRCDLLDACRSALAAHKVPAALRFVPSLELTAAGKLVRSGA